MAMAVMRGSFIMALLAFTNAARVRLQDEDMSALSGCKSIMARRVCLPVSDFLVDNLAGLDAKDLNCLQTYCETKPNCCETLEGLKKALDGHTSKSLDISKEKYEKLLAASGGADALPAAAPEDSHSPVVEKLPAVSGGADALPAAAPEDSHSPVVTKSVRVTSLLAEDVSAQSGCKSIMARRICLPVSNFLVDHLAGMDAKDLNCLQTYCETKPYCCETLEGLKKALDGHTSKSLHISEEKYEKLFAASGGADALPAAAPEDSHSPVVTKAVPVNLERSPIKTVFNIKKEPEPELKQVQEVEDQEVEAAATQGGEGVPDKCMCPAGSQVAGLGEYAKSNWRLQGVTGGKCVGSCDTCVRVYKGDRMACCVMLGPKKAGRCGKHVQAADFRGRKCVCGGLTEFKVSLAKKNPSCQPDTPCSECGYNCV